MDTLLKDEKFLPLATSLINTAEKSIYIATFKVEITAMPRGRKLKELFDLLAFKANGGVDVRLITNRRDNQGHIPDSNAYVLRELKSTKIKIRYLPNDRVCHAKILVVDKQLAIIGSHNLSVKSCHNNFEMSCYFPDELLSGRFAAAFEEVWDTAKEV